MWSVVLKRSAPFPYLSGFLAFRELPVLLEVIHLAESQGHTPELLFVDGNGILHPRGAGIATCLGVLTGLRTIGVSKKLLCGRLQSESAHLDGRCEITHQNRPVGMAVRGSARFRHVYVSPGHLINVRDAARMTEKVCYGHRLPEPLFHADALSRVAARSGSCRDD